MDSSDNNELFADSDDDQVDKEHNDRMQANCPPPDYIETQLFKDFQAKQFTQFNQKYGYMAIDTYKPFYFPGEIVRGSIMMDIFNDIPSTFRQVMIQFTGREMVGHHYKEVKDSLSRQRAEKIMSSLQANISNQFSGSFTKKGRSPERLGRMNENSMGSMELAKVDSKFDQESKKPSINEAKQDASLFQSNRAQRQKTIEDIAREQGSIQIENVVGVNNAFTKQSTIKEYEEFENKKFNSQLGANRSSFASNQQELNKSQKQKIKELDNNALIFIHQEAVAFKFKQPIHKGQYRIPFIMKLPQRLPGSFSLKHAPAKPGQQHPEDFKISYTFEAHIDGMRFELWQQKQITIRQFLFTEEEINDDLEIQHNIIQLNKVLNPTGKMDLLDHDLINKSEIQKNMPQLERMGSLKINKRISKQVGIKIEEVKPLGMSQSMNTSEADKKVQSMGSNQNKKMLQSQRIANIKQKKAEQDKQQGELEVQDIKKQSIKGLTSQNFQFKSKLKNQGCFSCLQPTINLAIQTRIPKILYFPNEIVNVQITIDNRESERRIQSINCYLRQKIRLLKHRDAEHGEFHSEVHDLHRIQISKGNFADMINKIGGGANEKDNRKRVYGQFNLQFDLKEILENLQGYRESKDNLAMSQKIKKAISHIKMEAPEEQSPALKINHNLNASNEFAQLPKEHVKDLVPIGQSGRSKIQVENVDVSNAELSNASAGELTKKKGVFKEDEASVIAFEKDMSKFVKDIEEITPYTVNGLSLVSGFAIVVRIEMERSGLSIFNKLRANEVKEEEIPIIIRSVKDADHIVDVMQLQNAEVKILAKKAQGLYPFIKQPFQLAACNMGQAGQTMGKSGFQSFQS